MRFKRELQEFFLGHLDKVFMGYSGDLNIRGEAASGGVVSTILIRALQKDIIDGALLTRVIARDGILKADSFIATTEEEILAARGSVYVESRPLRLLRKMEEFPGRLAFVGLPCDITHLKLRYKSKPELEKKIVFTIGLYCGHNSRHELIAGVLKKKGLREADVKSLRFRRGLWRGNMCVEMNDGRTVEFPFSDFSTYRNLHFFSEAKCLHCGDHTAEDADIACGDIWRRKMRSEKIKHSIIVSRNPQASEMLEGMRDDGSLEIQEGTPEDAFLANRRAIVEHKNLYLRSVLGKGLGYKVEKPEKGMPIRWNDILSTYIYLINDKISGSRRAKRLIWLVPKPILKLYLYFFKFLTHI